MRKTRTWLFFFLPILYVVVILGFVAFQFSKKSDSFSQSHGDLTVSGKTSGGGQPADLALRGWGLAFVFDSSHTLVVDRQDGTTSKLRPLSWTWKDGNVIVQFQQGIVLTFEKSDVGMKSLVIHPVVNDALKNVLALHVPFAADRGARFSSPPNRSFMEIDRDKTRVLASVDGDQDRVEASSAFVLVSNQNGFRSIRLDLLSPGMSATLAWLTIDNDATPEIASAALNQYWSRAYAGWSSATTFSNRLVDAWSREALARGEYGSAMAKIQALMNKSPKAWGFDAMSYLGNLMELTAEQRKSVEAASSRSQPVWAGEGNLWFEARHYGPDTSSDRLKSLLLTGTLPQDVPSLLAIFQNLKTIQTLQPSDSVSQRIDDVLNELLSSVVRREGSLFVQYGDGLLDLRSTLILGRVLMDYSRSLSNQVYATAGASLIVSALAYQDTAGWLPETLVTQDGKIVRQEGNLLAEDIYSSVKPAAPSETDLPDWGPGAFLHTPAKVESIAISAQQAQFRFRFPAGSAEHLIIVGVPAFDHITMHGIRWRTDPQFQSYTDGWAYSALTKTLYVKIRHREDLEDLVVHFQPEQ